MKPKPCAESAAAEAADLSEAAAADARKAFQTAAAEETAAAIELPLPKSCRRP